MFTYTFTCQLLSQRWCPIYPTTFCLNSLSTWQTLKVLSRFTHQRPSSSQPKNQSKIHVKHNAVDYSIASIQGSRSSSGRSTVGHLFFDRKLGPTPSTGPSQPAEMLKRVELSDLISFSALDLDKPLQYFTIFYNPVTSVCRFRICFLWFLWMFHNIFIATSILTSTNRSHDNLDRLLLLRWLLRKGETSKQPRPSFCPLPKLLLHLAKHLCKSFLLLKLKKACTIESKVSIIQRKRQEVCGSVAHVFWP